MDSSFEDKKSLFIKTLKEAYTKQYKAVQPIPFLRDRLLSVEKVFVGGGVEQQETTDIGHSWKCLKSYHELFTDNTSKSKRRVIEGEPGYGKSTLTLQIAYDWCNNVPDSPFSEVEILIILRLRQFWGVKSIFSAIKRLLVANEPRLKVYDIERIIKECSSVHIILDGYDEYPDLQTDRNNGVREIIRGNLMKEVDVTLMTRDTKALECDLPPEHQRFRLTGFDEKAKDEYLHKVVVDQGDKTAADKIRRILRENYFLDDFCQVPLIFVMFAHMVHEKADFKQMKTVTSVFRYIIFLFHYHQERKTKDLNVKNVRENYANNHDVLDKLALEGLRKGQITWRKNHLIRQLGQDFYDQYVSAGILVEDLLIDDFVGATGDRDINEVTGTRFYHKLLCEWYAAHSLVKERNIINVFRRFDPFELQFLFRFACGIRKEAFKAVNDWLMRIGGTQLLITLCLFESTDDEDEFMKAIRGICTREVTFNQRLSKVGQRSIIQMLEIASNNKIPVTCLNILGTVASVDKNGIVLLSGLRLQRLLSVEKIRILEQAHQTNVHEMKRLPEEDVLNFFTYIQQLELIQQLSLEGFVLPAFINPENLSFTFKSEGVEVYWTPRFTTVKLSLNLQSGLWKVSDKNGFRRALAQSRQDQPRGIRQLYDVLHTIASYNDIFVPEFILGASFLAADETETTWRLKLGYLSNVERVVVCPEHNQLLSNEELARIINFVKLSKRIRQLRFQPNQVPMEFPDSLLCSLRTSSCNSYVFCNLTGIIDFRLNFITGRWEVSSIDQLGLRLNREVLPLESTDSVSCRWAKLHMLKTASRNNIPVPVVVISDDILSADEGKLVFSSGDHLESSPVIEGIVFVHANLQFNNDLMSGLLKYANKSERLQQLRFCECIVPSPMSLDSIPLNLRARNFQVTWKCRNVEFDMNLLSGHWEVKDLMRLEKVCSQGIVMNASDDSLQQVALVQLLLIAARQSVRIQSLQLVNSFLNVEDDKITLSTAKRISKLFERSHFINTTVRKPPVVSLNMFGYTLSITRQPNTTIQQTPLDEILPDVILPPIQSLKRLEIISTTEKEVSTDVLPNLCRFSQQCSELQEIRITDILLSGSLSLNLIPSVPIIWSLQVPFGGLRWDYRLNSGMARWEFEDIQTLRKLCESPIYLRGSDRKLIQASTIQIMEVACSYDVAVSCLVLDESLGNIGGGCIALTSDLSVPSLPSLRKLVVISGVNKTLSKSEVSELISCSQMFKQLQEICFNDKVLPLPVSSETAKRVPRNLKVCWGHYGYKLAPEKFLWEVDDDNVLRELCSSTVVIHKDDDQSLHECQKLLLINASNHQIPVTRLALNQSFSKSTEDSIILSSGSSLPHLSTVGEIELWMEQGHKIEEDELIAILEYGGKCKELRHIRFFGCLLPYQIHEESISSLPSMDNTQVTWLAYRLNLKTGTWQNKETLTDLTEDQYKTKIEVMQKRRDTSHL